jgi:hypothetical protein
MTCAEPRQAHNSCVKHEQIDLIVEAQPQMDSRLTVMVHEGVEYVSKADYDALREQHAYLISKCKDFIF